MPEAEKKKPRTSAAVKNRYNSKAYDRITVVVPKGKKDEIKDHIGRTGESMNAFITRAIKETEERDKIDTSKN